MANAAGEQTRVVVWYAVWATICAAAAGAVVALLDSFVLSHLSHRAGILNTFVEEVIGILAIAAGQGAVALVTGSIMAQLGRAVQATVLLGLLIGAFDFLFDLVQILVPATEVEWLWKLVASLVVAVGVTLWGTRRQVASTLPS
jgi:hypothetical protein